MTGCTSSDGLTLSVTRAEFLVAGDAVRGVPAGQGAGVLWRAWQISPRENGLPAVRGRKAIFRRKESRVDPALLMVRGAGLLIAGPGIRCEVAALPELARSAASAWIWLPR
jgi:hypothetical protein